MTFTVHLYLETPLSEQTLGALADQLIDGEEAILRVEDAAKVDENIDTSSLTSNEHRLNPATPRTHAATYCAISRSGKDRSPP